MRDIAFFALSVLFYKRIVLTRPKPPRETQTYPSTDAQPSNAVVTKAFCIEVLQNVIKRQPPYFVDGKFTGDCRKDLVDQCGERMCQWALVYKAAASDCPGCPTSCGASAPVSGLGGNLHRVFRHLLGVFLFDCIRSFDQLPQTIVTVAL